MSTRVCIGRRASPDHQRKARPANLASPRLRHGLKMTQGFVAHSQELPQRVGVETELEVIIRPRAEHEVHRSARVAVIFDRALPRDRCPRFDLHISEHVLAPPEVLVFITTDAVADNVDTKNVAQAASVTRSGEFPRWAGTREAHMRTPRARALGKALREAREETGRKLREFADEIGRDPGLLSRWETGERSPSSEQVAQILTKLGISGDRFEEIIALARATDEPRWLAIT